MKWIHFLKKIVRLILVFLAWFTGAVIVYFIAAFFLGRLSVNDHASGSGKEVTLYLMNNGVHTDIVMPARSNHKDWTELFPTINTQSQDSLPEYISIGWGDKGFYLETPSWGELKFSTAFKAAFWLSSAAMHTTYYRELPPNQEKVPFKVSEKQYNRLIHYIEHSLLLKNKRSVFIPTDAVYGDNDAFYDAVGSYSLFHTCNTWVNNALKACDQKACVWTPFASSIFYHYK